MTQLSKDIRDQSEVSVQELGIKTFKTQLPDVGSFFLWIKINVKIEHFFFFLSV